MKNLLTLMAFFFMIRTAGAQSGPGLAVSPQHKNDSVSSLILQYINVKSADKLYDLASDDLRKKVGTHDRWNKIFETTYFNLGKYKKNTLQSFNKGVSKYKAEFDQITLDLFVSLDKSGKLTTLEFHPLKGQSVIRQ